MFKIILLAVFVALAAAQETIGEHPCDDDVFCYGEIIKTVELVKPRLYKDSKTFVDMPLKVSREKAYENFEALKAKYPGAEIPQADVKAFVDANFEVAGTEFIPYTPGDWKADPAFLAKIEDLKLQEFASELNSFWKNLSRNISPKVKANPELYSMLYVNNPVVVPGGRFREFYYWDQYWILKGLLHCEMYTSVRQMIENFFQMVEEIGFIPNGGRKYYQRSQPPLLIPMVKDYLDFSKNPTFLADNIGTLDKEFDFWMTNRSYSVIVDEKEYSVFRYNVELDEPRPEAYMEDYELAEKLPENQRAELYMNLKTAAESGIDFGHRWFVPEKPEGNPGVLGDCKARHIVPVDLNALILRNAKYMSTFHNQLKNTEKAKYYSDIAIDLEVAINAVFWNEAEGSWFDFVDIEGRRGHKIDFFPGNILPLILGLPTMTAKITKVLAYLDKTGVLKLSGGIPASMEQTGEQWDFPNAWAPHNHWFIESLEATKNPQALEIAKQTAQKWVSNNLLTYRGHQNTMFEKYDASTPGAYGKGGEYDVVLGFGWSNGAVLDLMAKYPDLQGAGMTALVSVQLLVVGAFLALFRNFM